MNSPARSSLIQPLFAGTLDIVDDVHGEIDALRSLLRNLGYDGPCCVFGHYSIPDGQPRGNGLTFCVDYGVGKRWTERRAGTTDDFKLKLAALRWPERVVVFDERGSG